MSHDTYDEPQDWELDPYGIDPITAARDRFPRLDWATIWATAGDEPEWIVEPILERGRLVALFSPPKVGKSLLSLELVAAIATGRPVLGNPPREPRHVVYVDFENSPRDLVERLTDLGYTPDDLHNLHYLSFPSMAALNTPGGAKDLVAAVAAYGGEVVVIDTVSRVVAGDEDSSETFNELYRLALAPLKAQQITVLRLDHSGKDLEKGQRGSSAKNADVDDVWRLAAITDGKRYMLTRTMSRHGHGDSAIELERRRNPLRHAPLNGGPIAEGAGNSDVQRLARLLGDLKIPTEHGRDRARVTVLNIVGANDPAARFRNDTWAAALKIHKARGEVTE